MKKGIRVLLLAIMMLAIYGGVSTQEWKYPIAIVALSLLAFVGTLSVKGTAKNSGKASRGGASAAIVAGGSSSNNCSDSSSGGDC